MELKNSSYMEFDYVNWKGIKSHRKVKANRILFGENEYHPGKQWLLQAFDIDKQAERVFAMKDMKNIKYCQ